MSNIARTALRTIYNATSPLLSRIYPHLYRLIAKVYFDMQQRRMLNEFGFGPRARADDRIYRAYLEKFPAKRLLDIGCGYGRLFPVYAELNIPDVIGIDISPYAISKVKKAWPNYTAQVMMIEDIKFPPNHFDAAISNNALAYVLPDIHIRQAVDKIAEQCRSILLVEKCREIEGGEREYAFPA